MTWKTPEIKEIACGMEINMYGPADDDRRDDDTLF
ncbi:MAG: pyrroloquinoline quinone precursor peptide PqqA [Rhodobacteraceae bacterium]|nr:MAG: pyrroloquinoline quinone precursor peptide PqqA [Paracoccaceae bacterium]